MDTKALPPSIGYTASHCFVGVFNIYDATKYPQDPFALLGTLDKEELAKCLVAAWPAHHAALQGNRELGIKP